MKIIILLMVMFNLPLTSFCANPDSLNKRISFDTTHVSDFLRRNSYFKDGSLYLKKDTFVVRDIEFNPSLGDSIELYGFTSQTTIIKGELEIYVNGTLILVNNARYSSEINGFYRIRIKSSKLTIKVNQFLFGYDLVDKFALKVKFKKLKQGFSYRIDFFLSAPPLKSIH